MDSTELDRFVSSDRRLLKFEEEVGDPSGMLSTLEDKDSDRFEEVKQLLDQMGILEPDGWDIPELPW